MHGSEGAAVTICISISDVLDDNEHAKMSDCVPGFHCVLPRERRYHAHDTVQRPAYSARSSFSSLVQIYEGTPYTFCHFCTLGSRNT